ncbi:hypothetical protein SDC9_185602 [bioreactor metagenome]|uniref:Uncharacterized protein n=1 Tax=bioreactor metagenome TaxID=1076179 RepID=A0A645HIQ9_9ZZZZ
MPNVLATPAVLKNYTFSTQTADFTINPQVVYNLNTTDTVKGFPGTQWFDLGSNATIATAKPPIMNSTSRRMFEAPPRLGGRPPGTPRL